MQTSAVFEEQKNGIINQATHELGMQHKNPARRPPFFFEQHLQQQKKELPRRNFDYENSRGFHMRLFRGHEEVHQAAPSHVRQEFESLRCARWSEAHLRWEIDADVTTQKDNRDDNARSSRSWTKVSPESTNSRSMSWSCRKSSTHCRKRKILKISRQQVVQFPFTSQVL